MKLINDFYVNSIIIQRWNIIFHCPFVLRVTKERIRYISCLIKQDFLLHNQEDLAFFMSSVNFMVQQALVYVRMTILIIVFVEELFNTIIFLSFQTFRQNSCVFYQILMSIVKSWPIVCCCLVTCNDRYIRK